MRTANFLQKLKAKHKPVRVFAKLFRARYIFCKTFFSEITGWHMNCIEPTRKCSEIVWGKSFTKTQTTLSVPEGSGPSIDLING
jgi:hypothetical protein